MDIEGIAGGIFLLTIGILVVVPLPLDGGFIWLPPDPTITAIVLAATSLLIIVGTFLIVAGFRSKKKSQPRKVAGATCLLISFFILFAGFIAETEFWASVSLVLGIGLLVAGVFLVGIRENTKKTKSAH